MSVLVINAGTKGLAFTQSLINNNIDTYIMYGVGSIASGVLKSKPTFKERVRNNMPADNYADPVKFPEKFAQQVLDMIKYIKPEIIFPVNAAEITALFPYRKQIELLGCVFPFGPFKIYETLRNKNLFYDFCAQHNLDICPAYKKIPFKNFYIKPVDKTSGKGVQKIIGNYLVQEEFQGVGVGYEAFCHKGKVMAHFMHKRKREYPVKGGSSTSRFSWLHTGIAKDSKKLIKLTNWTGFIMLEYKYNERTNKYKLIECNPRPWGSIQLAIDSGINFPVIAYNYFIKKQISFTQDYSLNTETRIVPYDMLAGICYLFKGDWRNFIDAFSIWKKFNWEAFKPFNYRFFIINILFTYTAIKMLLLPFVERLRRR